MNKKQFETLFKEAAKEFDEEKRERMKTLIKSRLEEYEAAKTTVNRIERMMDEMKRTGYKDVELLEYDE